MTDSMNKKAIQIIIYLVAVIMLSTSAIYFVTGYQQLTDESGNGFHEMRGDSENLQATSDLDKSQWNEIDLGGKVQTVFFLVVATTYVPVGLWTLKKEQSMKPYIISLVGSLTLIVFYIVSRMVYLPIVGIQNDVGTMDVTVKVLQAGIIAGSSYLLMTRKKLENNPT